MRNLLGGFIMNIVGGFVLLVIVLTLLGYFGNPLDILRHLIPWGPTI